MTPKFTPATRAWLCAFCLPGLLLPGLARAQDTDEVAALRAQMQVILQRLDALSTQQEAAAQQQQALARTVAAAPAAATAITTPAAPAAPSADARLDALLKGFYGNLDVSLDDSTKGISAWSTARGRWDGSAGCPGCPAINPCWATAAKSASATATSISSTSWNRPSR